MGDSIYHNRNKISTLLVLSFCSSSLYFPLQVSIGPTTLYSHRPYINLQGNVGDSGSTGVVGERGDRGRSRKEMHSKTSLPVEKSRKSQSYGLGGGTSSGDSTPELTRPRCPRRDLSLHPGDVGYNGGGSRRLSYTCLSSPLITWTGKKSERSQDMFLLLWMKTFERFRLRLF